MSRVTNRCGAALLACALALGGCGKPPPSAATNATPAVAKAPTLAAPARSDAADVKAYLESLYAHYKTSKNNTFQMFDANVGEVFDPDTIRLLAADAKTQHGEVGAIDGDWLCDCQDFESLAATIAVQSATPTAAKATAEFRDLGIPQQGVRRASFDLVKSGGVWRIHDLTDEDQPSLRKILTDEIAAAKKGGPADQAP
jgi:hypothetical protein